MRYNYAAPAASAAFSARAFAAFTALVALTAMSGPTSGWAATAALFLRTRGVPSGMSASVSHSAPDRMAGVPARVTGVAARVAWMTSGLAGMTAGVAWMTARVTGMAAGVAAHITGIPAGMARMTACMTGASSAVMAARMPTGMAAVIASGPSCACSPLSPRLVPVVRSRIDRLAPRMMLFRSTLSRRLPSLPFSSARPPAFAFADALRAAFLGPMQQHAQ